MKKVLILYKDEVPAEGETTGLYDTAKLDVYPPLSPLPLQLLPLLSAAPCRARPLT